MDYSASNTTEDTVILEKVKAGDTALFAAITRKYNRRLYRIAFSYLKDEEGIEDVLQNTYLKCYASLGKFRNEASFSTWLTRILINECLQVLRERKKKGETGQLSDLPATNLSPDVLYMQSQAKQIFERAVEALPEKLRVVYIMREVEGMNTIETARALEITETNVKVRLNRAKESLKKDLLKLFHPSDLFNFQGEKCERITTSVMKVLLPV